MEDYWITPNEMAVYPCKMINFNIKHQRILNGIIAELVVASICFPLNTLKIRKQLNLSPRGSLYNGIRYCLLNEFVDAAVFFSIFENVNVGNSFLTTGLGSSVGSLVSNVISYPLYLRTRLRQSGVTTKISSNYQGFVYSLMCSLPSTTINYTIKRSISNKYPALQIISGYLSTVVSLFVTQPINNLAIYKQTKLPFKIMDIFNYRSFGIRLVEQTIQVGTKLFIMDKLNDSIKL